MESQMSPAIWLPTVCHINSGIPLHDAAANKQLIRPLVTTQPVLLPSQGGHVLVQMQQMMPFLAPDAPAVQLQPCPDFVTPNLVVQPLPCLPHQVGHAVMESSVQQMLPKLQQVRHKLNMDVNSNPLNKTQRKKKISPSAKRRSRLRLIAFLEAKKEKSALQGQAPEKEQIGELATINESPTSTTSPTYSPNHDPNTTIPGEEIDCPCRDTEISTVSVEQTLNAPPVSDEQHHARQDSILH